MEANPWAVVVFLVTGAILFGAGLTHPTVLSLSFVVFTIGWFGMGCLWDALRFRDRDRGDRD